MENNHCTPNMCPVCRCSCWWVHATGLYTKWERVGILYFCDDVAVYFFAFIDGFVFCASSLAVLHGDRDFHLVDLSWHHSRAWRDLGRHLERTWSCRKTWLPHKKRGDFALGTGRTRRIPQRFTMDSLFQPKFRFIPSVESPLSTRYCAALRR